LRYVTDTQDQVDLLLREMKVDDFALAALLDPGDIRRDQGRALRRSPSLWTAVAFAAATAAMLVLFLGVGVGKSSPSHSPTSQTVTPASRPNTHTRSEGAKAAALREAQERVAKADEQVEAAIQATNHAEGVAKKEAEEQVAKAEKEAKEAVLQLGQQARGAEHPKTSVTTVP
jgi:hypothetical protein